MEKRRMIVGGNWKMYKTPGEAVATAKALKVKLINVHDVDVVVCPPFPALVPAYEILKGTNGKLGGQNLYWEEEGAYTGEVSAQMLKEAGCEYVIVGHSERRHIFGENDLEINKKIRKSLEKDIIPIICVGEKIEERRNGLTRKVVENQIRAGLNEIELNDSVEIVVAYEPVWAIGTGENATPQQAEEVHFFIRELISEMFGADFGKKIRIQYGGSVKPVNAEDLMRQDNIDGALVGGASLNAEKFADIIKSAERVSN